MSSSTNIAPKRTNETKLLQVQWAINAAGAAVALAVVAATYTFVLQPLAERNRTARVSTSEVRSFLEKKQEISNKLASVQQTLDEHLERLDGLLKRIPQSPDEGEFLSQLSELSHETNVRIRQYDPGQSNDTGRYASLDITVEAEASYESLCRFLDGLAHLPRLSEVTALAIECDDPTAEFYPLTLTLRIFYFRPVDSDDQAEGSDV